MVIQRLDVNKAKQGFSHGKSGVAAKLLLSTVSRESGMSIRLAGLFATKRRLDVCYQREHDFH